jgi:NitT/TauT family transport system substrate-binding protein
VAPITLVLAAVWLGPGSATAQTKTVRLGIGIDMSHAEWVLLAEKGFGRKYGIQVEYKTFETGVAGLDAVMAGQMDVGAVSELAGLVSASKRGNIVGLARPWYSGTIGGLAAAKEIRTPADLVGKKVAVHPGSGSEFFYRFFFARKHNLEGKVEVVNLPVPEQLQAMARGDIQAASTWYPWLGRLPQVVAGGHVLQQWQDSGYTSQHTLWMNKRLVAEDRKTAVAFLQAVRDTIDWANASPANWTEMAKVAAKAFRISEDVALTQLNYNKFVLDLTDDFIRHQIEAAKFARQAGLLQIADPEQYVKGLYDPSLLKEAAPERATITLIR